MKREKGSITIFSLLSLLLITAAMFALLEGTRLQEMRRFADLQTQAALESVFANYNSCLWEMYHLLGTEKTQMRQMLEQIANGRVGEGTNLLRLKAEKIVVEDDVRLTDAEGRIFIQSAAEYMSDNWIYETAKELYSQYEAIKHLMESSQMDVGDIDAALREMEKIQEPDPAKAIRLGLGKTQESKVDVKGLLQAAKSWKQHGILKLVIEDTDVLSKAEQDFSDGLLKRRLEKGTNAEEQDISWQERILFQQYLMTYMSYFQAEQEERALSYELEYLLGAKSSDIENLKVVTMELLAIREAANFLYLISSPLKMAEVEFAAELVGGVSLNPIIIEVVKMGLLTAWVLAESILDVRAILAGKRIPLLKSDETWTTELESLGGITNGYPMAKETAWGFDYENYLSVLLLMIEEQDIAMRTMNVQEATMRMVCGDDTIRMDSLLVAAEVKMEYSYKPVFPFLRFIDAEERWEYRVLGKESYGYY